MRPFLRRPLIGLCLYLLAVPGFAAAAEPPADAPLKEKGLRKAGTTYILPAEADVQKKLNAARALYQSASASASQKDEYEQGVADGQMQMRQIEQQLLELNQNLAQGLPPAQNNQVVGMVNALNIRLGQLRRQASDDTRQVVGARLASAREEFLQAVLDLRQLVDKTDKQYKELAADPAVKAAIDGLNNSGQDKAKPRPKTKLQYTLGPSRSYLANVKQLEKAEAAVLTEDVAVRKEGGVYWVDVTFNGRVTRPMVFDTGASAVVLPAGLAAQIGLTPAAGAQEVTARVADGSEVKAHRMTVPSLRVGKFTVQNVECIVMPENQKDVPPLLGQTFQRNFSIKFNADAGKLVLSRLDGGDGPPPAPPTGNGLTGKSKASTKAGRNKRAPRGDLFDRP